jgi:hypothetical protein
MGSRASLISSIVIRPLIGLELSDILLLCAWIGVLEGVFLPNEPGELQFDTTFVTDSRLLHSVERIPPFLTVFATRALRACLSDLVAREVAKDMIVCVDWWNCLYFIDMRFCVAMSCSLKISIVENYESVQ